MRPIHLIDDLSTGQIPRTSKERQAEQTKAEQSPWVDEISQARLQLRFKASYIGIKPQIS